MEHTPFDSQIAELSATIERLRLEMDAVAKSFIESAVAPVQAWYKERVETSVRKDPDHLVTLTPEQVRLVKSDLQQLVDGAGQIVRKNLDKPSCWTHQSPISFEGRSRSESTYEQGYRPSSPTSPSETRDEAFRQMLGEAGSLLVKHGFMKAKGDYTNHNRALTYGGQFPYSEGMKASIQNYGVLSKQYIEAHEQLHKAERDRIQHQANNLWESN
jgi:hypothetical protein